MCSAIKLPACNYLFLFCFLSRSRRSLSSRSLFSLSLKSVWVVLFAIMNGMIDIDSIPFLTRSDTPISSVSVVYGELSPTTENGLKTILRARRKRIL